VTKPIAAFGVIGDPRCTVRLDENSHLMIYFFLSAGISPHGRYQPHGQWRHLEVDATVGGRVYGWLSVDYRVSVNLEAGSGWSLRPPTAIYRLYLEAHFTYNWGSEFLSVG
jgi:hypothetical protein